MKKILVILCGLLFCVLLVGCSCSNETGHIHVWSEGKVLKPATETENGAMIYTCLGCEEMKTTVIPKLEHKHIYEGEWLTNRMAHWHACGTEGCTIVGDKDFHIWDSGKILEEANQTNTGKMLFTCTECGYSKEENYRGSPTVDASGWVDAMEGGSFTNVTFYYSKKTGNDIVENISVEIDNGSIKYTKGDNITYDLDVAGAQLGSVAMAELFSGYRNSFDSFNYDSSTRSYMGDVNGEKVAIQFSDGNVCYVSITSGDTVTVISLSKYGSTEVGAR